MGTALHLTQMEYHPTKSSVGNIPFAWIKVSKDSVTNFKSSV